MTDLRKNQTVIIIGGGPAGMSCALWLKNAGLNPIIVEKLDALGGMQARSSASNTWLLGWQSCLGKDVAAQFGKHIAYERIQTFFNATVYDMTPTENDEWLVSITPRSSEPGSMEAEPISMKAAAIVIAAGTEFSSKQWINSVEGARQIESHILSGPSSYMDTGKWFGSRPVVIGGGDNALECAYVLSKRGSHPLLITRSDHFRAGQDSQDKLLASERSGLLDVKMGKTVKEVSDDCGQKYILTLDDDTQVVATSIFLMLGYESNAKGLSLDFLKNNSHSEQAGDVFDKNEYFLVDKNCETPYRNLFAVGDIANPDHPCVATAVAMGTMAARTIINRLKD